MFLVCCLRSLSIGLQCEHLWMRNCTANQCKYIPMRKAFDKDMQQKVRWHVMFCFSQDMQQKVRCHFMFCFSQRYAAESSMACHVLFFTKICSSRKFDGMSCFVFHKDMQQKVRWHVAFCFSQRYAAESSMACHVLFFTKICSSRKFDGMSCFVFHKDMQQKVRWHVAFCFSQRYAAESSMACHVLFFTKICSSRKFDGMSCFVFHKDMQQKFDLQYRDVHIVGLYLNCASSIPRTFCCMLFFCRMLVCKATSYITRNQSIVPLTLNKIKTI